MLSTQMACGVISVDEFAVHYMAVGLTREESKKSFDTIQ